MTSTLLLTIVPLTSSNIFMTLAWYGHLRFLSFPLWAVILASWGVAFFEYCFQVPANRIGYQVISAYQLKTLQEIITLTVFVLFAQLYLGEGLKPKHVVGSSFWQSRRGLYFKNNTGWSGRTISLV